MSDMANSQPRPGYEVAAVVPFQEFAPSDVASRSRLMAWVFLGYLALIAYEYLGLSEDIPLLGALHFSTILSYTLIAIVVLRPGRAELFKQRQVKILLAFLAMTALSVFHAFVRTYAMLALRGVIGYFGLLILTALVIDSRERLEKLSKVLMVIVVVLVYRNLDQLTSSVRIGSFRAGYFLGDGNDFAWGMNVILPLVCGLLMGQRSLRFRAVVTVGLLAGVVGVIGTQSRGGTLGFGAAIIYGWLVAVRRKTLGAVVLVLFAAGVAMLAPASYFQRLGTVRTYQQDNSARSRLQVWGVAFQMAVDHPLGVGAGNFSSFYGRFYMPEDGKSTMDWGQRRWLSAHSIYFKVLGEYGFPGLGLLLWLLYAIFRDNAAAHRWLLDHPGRAPLDPRWPVLLNMSLIGFAVSGVFLGGVNYPHLYLLAGLSIGTKLMLGKSEELELLEAAPAGDGGSAGASGRT